MPGIERFYREEIRSPDLKPVPRTQRNQHSPARQLPAPLLNEQHGFDALLLEDPIPGPKPWTDELERAAIAGCAYACPPLVSLKSLGVASPTASAWLSDDPPEAYRSACLALAERLKKASSWCERSLLARIAIAGSEPRFWTASAWLLERSKAFSHQYVAAIDPSALGPSIIVNVGQLVVNHAPERSLPNRADIIDAEAIQAQNLVSESSAVAQPATGQ